MAIALAAAIACRTTMTEALGVNRALADAIDAEALLRATIFVQTPVSIVHAFTEVWAVNICTEAG